jgi:hypothetical protein
MKNINKHAANSQLHKQRVITETIPSGEHNTDTKHIEIMRPRVLLNFFICKMEFCPHLTVLLEELKESVELSTQN